MTKTLRNGLILLAAVGLALSVAVTQTPDGETPANEGICDELHGGTPGLYGLCVAFCEAHDCALDPSAENPFESCKPGSVKVLDKYNQKKKAGDPDMPCILPAECPCFTQAELEAFPPQPSGQYSQCDASGPVKNIIASFTPRYAAQGDGDSGSCLYIAGTDLRSQSDLTAGEVGACSDAIEAAIDASPYCP